MMVGVAFWNALYTGGIGAVSGVVWGFALDADLLTPLIIGLVVGAVVGVALTWLANAASRDSQRQGGGLEMGEAQFASGSVVVLPAVVLVGLGLVVWFIRVLVT